jgi:uncharacterized protein YdeI (YjbR/CyaY-like superfamily)
MPKRATVRSIQTKPAPEVPADVRKALAGAPAAKAQWGELTPIARRDFLRWIDEAKQAETRRRRIERACDMLATGKRRPCCFAVVPLDLHKALGSVPHAKATWRTLTSDERRDVIDWIALAKERDARKRRVEDATVLLATGKPLPAR